MSDELDCFRRAAELGCSRFLLVGHGTHFILPHLQDAPKLWSVRSIVLPSENKLVNEDAAAVCAEWWNDQASQYFDLRGDDKPDKWQEDFLRMIDLCRAFRKKYGDVQCKD